MILGLRVEEKSIFTGMQIFILNDWLHPIEELGETCFNVFDMSLDKLKTDSEATRIYPVDSKEREIANLNTATEVALNSLPERFKKTAKLYTLALSREDNFKILYRLPRWTFLQAENESGEIFNLLSLSESSSGLHWKSLKIQTSEKYLHLRLFSAQEPPSIAQPKKVSFYRCAKFFDSKALMEGQPFYISLDSPRAR